MAKRTLMMYRTYSFKDKDPIIDRLRTAVQDSDMTYTQICDMTGGVSRTTLTNWFDGPTRRPQFATVMAVFRACGVDLKETPYSLRGNSRKS